MPIRTAKQQASPEAQRRLERLFMRLKRDILDEVLALVGGFTSSSPVGGITIVPAAVPPLAGDATGAIGANTVGKLQGIPVSTTDPTEGQVLTAVSGVWTPADPPEAALAAAFTAKGDLLAGTGPGAYAVLPAPASTGYYLRTDPTEPTGLRWIPLPDELLTFVLDGTDTVVDGTDRVIEA